MNKVRCLKCKTVLHSKHRHDFVQCKCGDVFIDGGDSYSRTGLKPGAEVQVWEEGDDW